MVATDGNLLIEFTAKIVSAYVSYNSLPAKEIGEIITKTHGALSALGQELMSQPTEIAATPAVPIKKSVTPDYIYCLEDGLKFKSLRRHLREKFGMTPTDYRTKWNLPPDYPMVSPNYAITRSQLARASGLGTKP